MRATSSSSAGGVSCRSTFAVVIVIVSVATLPPFAHANRPEVSADSNAPPPAPSPKRDAPPSDPIAGREHWAFQPLRASAPPAIDDGAWPRSSIDRFVLAPLEASGLSPAPDADRRTLLRRVHFALVGLPPTPDETRRFLRDERPDAFERVVDDLLASPRFGERWGRHWLDLARYADSNGLDENFLFREAWRYRNWVIDAVNADMPLDRFLLEQIAGDLLPYDSIEERDRQRIATGFLLVGPKVLLGNDPRKQRMEVADEQIDTIGRALLGQTLGCARCHDHKFDPFPTADYYALAGIFTSTQIMERRYMLGEQRVMERLVGLGAEGDALDDAYETYWRERPRLGARLEKAKSALDALKKGDTKAFEEVASKHADAVAKEAIDAALASEKRVEAQEAFVSELAKTFSNPPPIPPRAIIPSDVEKPGDEHIRIAGQFDRLGDVVPRGFPRVFGETSIAIPADQSGRVELARWLTDVDSGAGELVARVLANRVWYHLIGRGIVRTVDNFGRTGEPPSHPALLDHLARRLIEEDWSLKKLVREIVLSRTFAMSSRHDERAHEHDPENVLLWRAHRRRLDPESYRDAMLFVAGKLDLTPMGSTVWYLGDQATAVGKNENRRRTDFPCRSVYLPVIESHLPELFEAFDFADPHTTTGMRPDTTGVKQGLFSLNADVVMKAAESLARRVLSFDGVESDEARVDRLFELAIGKPASEVDRAETTAFIAEIEKELLERGDADPRLRAWALAAHALFASSRFQIVE